jgi:hypothetical protein
MTHAAQFALKHGAPLLFIWILLDQAGVPARTNLEQLTKFRLSDGSVLC